MADERPDNSLSEAEYDRWLSTTDAMSLLMSVEGWKAYTATKTITQRLKDGLIAVAAKHLVWKSEGNREKLEFHQWTIGAWPDRTDDPRHDFWKSGDVEFDVPAEGYAIKAGPIVALYSVRFRPEDIQSIIPPLGKVSIAEETPKTPSSPIAAAELERFCRLYVAIWEDRSVEDRAWVACKATYPDNKVARDPFREVFREIRGPVKPGKKPSGG